jgi:GTP-binding protein EngB required for normal cell division
MRESLVGLLEKADLAIAASSGVLDPSTVETLVESARIVRARIDFPDDLKIVGLAGGTGSGKSSLVNAIAGSQIADVGGIRPTTDTPLAVATEGRLGHVRGYLDEVGITELAAGDVGDDLCLIDLPDTDSVELEHRQRVEALLPALDAVVWVVDPEKYRDASLHRGLIRRLAGRAHQFLFVFNQIDRVAPARRDDLLADFEAALREDGVETPSIVATAAAPGTGPPEGISELLTVLGEIDASSVVDRAVERIGEAATTLLGAIGESGLDFEGRSAQVAAKAAGLVESGELDAATDALAEFTTDLAAETTGLSRDRIASVASLAPAAVQTSHEDGADAEDRQEAINDALQRRYMDPLREILRHRAEVIAAATELSVSVAAVRSRHLV